MRIIENPVDGFWQDVVKSSSNATFFHTPKWAKIFSGTYANHTISTRGFDFGSGKKMVIPLMSISKGPKGYCRSFISSVPGVYGGPVCTGDVDGEMVAQGVNAAVRCRFTDVTITGNPLFCTELPRWLQRTKMFTHLIELEKGFDQIFSNYDREARRRTKNGINKGVKVRRAADWNDFMAYYKTYEDSKARWGDKISKSYDVNLFRNIYVEAQNDNNIRLWLAEYEGKVIGGALAFYWNRHVVEWHAAFIREYAHMSPNNVLKTEIIKNACDEGYAFYDLNPSGGHDGVIEFKESLGAKKVSIDIWRHRSISCMVLSHACSLVNKVSNLNRRKVD